MSSEHIPPLTAVTEADLQAYVDDRLPAPRLAEVERWLAAHPKEIERLATYRAQQQALQARFNPILQEPLPQAMRDLAQSPALNAAGPTSSPPWFARWHRLLQMAWAAPVRHALAGLLIAAAGGAVGWLAHGKYANLEQLALRTSLPHQAAVAHVVFSPDVRRPVEISAEHEDQLVTWLSKRLGTRVRPPKLGAQGYELVGGRLLPGSSGPVAQFMYQDSSGQRLTLYVSTDDLGTSDTAFRFAKEGPVNVFYWVDRKFGYALSAGIAKNELARIATAVYDQLDRN